MYKKILIIISMVLILALVVFCCLYFIPKTTPIDITLNAVKYDSTHGDANELGTVQIHVHGTLKDYLFRSDELELNIDDFDHLYDIRPWPNSDPYDNSTDFEINLDGDGYHGVFSYQASSTVTGEDSAKLDILFRNDLKKWELFVTDHYFTDAAVKDDPALNLAYRATVE